MKNIIILSLSIITLLLFNCNSFNSKKQTTEPDAKIDSCTIAMKFENAKVAEGMVDKNYSGELKNYWGEDKTKLDFKHIYKQGQLIKSYFYYESQALQEEYSFKCGALHGEQKWYFENGNIAKLIPYSYGFRNGFGLLYYETGQLRQRILFKNDTVVGKIEYFDETGKSIKTETNKE
jgi:antitoxin component YwqK of YwqJK toxin-antitoxin module